MCNILTLFLQAFMYILFITVFFTLFLSCIGSLFLFLFDEEFLKDHLGYQLMRTNPCSFYLNINRLETTVFTFLLSNQLFSKPIGLSLENLNFEDDLLTTCFFLSTKKTQCSFITITLFYIAF